ncbi:MAG: flagellar protein FlaG [Burkholderiaceae bacterium]
MSLFPLSSYADGTVLPAPVTVPSRQASVASMADSGIRPGTQRSSAVGTDAIEAVDGSRRVQRSDNEKLDHAIDAINRFLQPVNSSVRFAIDENSGRTLVKVIDTDTNDVIRQFPSKEALAISRDLDRFQGLLVKDQA